MKRICLLFLFFCFNLHLFAGKLPKPLVVDTAKIAWVSGEYEDEYTRTILVGLKDVESISTIEIAQWDEGFTIPYIFTLPSTEKNFFKVVVDKEFDTRFTITAYNDFGSSETEFVLHPKDITKTVTLGIEEVNESKKEIATIYSLAGRMVWRGSSADVEQALRNLPKGVYIVKKGKTSKKVFR